VFVKINDHDSKLVYSTILCNELKKKGKTVLEIFRTGLGKQTEYHVKAVR